MKSEFKTKLGSLCDAYRNDFSCSLQTGTKVICVFDMVVAMVSVICHVLEMNMMLTTKSRWSEDDDLKFAMRSLLTESVMKTLTFITSGLALRVAVENSRASFLIPWLVVSGFSIVTGVVHFLYVATHGRYSEMFVYLFLTALLPHLWLVVYNFYRQLKGKNSGGSQLDFNNSEAFLKCEDY